MDNLSSNESFNSYPNPSSGQVNIESDQKMIKYDLYSTNGKGGRRENINMNSLNITNLSTGVYQIIIYFEDGISTERLEVIK